GHNRSGCRGLTTRDFGRECEWLAESAPVSAARKHHSFRWTVASEQDPPSPSRLTLSAARIALVVIRPMSRGVPNHAHDVERVTRQQQGHSRADKLKRCR